MHSYSTICLTHPRENAGLRNRVSKRNRRNKCRAWGPDYSLQEIDGFQGFRNMFLIKIRCHEIVLWLSRTYAILVVILNKKRHLFSARDIPQHNSYNISPATFIQATGFPFIKRTKMADVWMYCMYWTRWLSICFRRCTVY